MLLVPWRVEGGGLCCWFLAMVAENGCRLHVLFARAHPCLIAPTSLTSLGVPDKLGLEA